MTESHEALNSFAHLEPCCENPQVFCDERGELICAHCGLVHERVMISKSRRAYNHDEQVERWHAFPDGLFSKRRFNVHEANCSSTRRATLYRMQFLDDQVTNTSNRQPRKYQRMLFHRAKVLELPRDVLDTGLVYIAKIQHSHIMIGYSAEVFIDACLLLACETCNCVQFTIHDVRSLGIRMIYKIMNMCRGILDVKRKPVPARALVFKYCHKVGMNIGEIKETIALLRKIKIKSGRSLIGYIGAAIYMTQEFTQLYLAETLNVTEVTIRSRIKEIEKQLRPGRATQTPHQAGPGPGGVGLQKVS